MKLNLLPTYVSKGAQGRVALVGSLVFLLACIGLTVAMISMSSGKLAASRQAWEDARPPAEAALKEAQKAETIAALGTERKRNLDLTQAMDAQNRKYTTFYDAIKTYIPSFMRVNAMSVIPIDEKSCRLNLTGVLKTYQQYADASLALLRIPGAVNVSRAGYEINDIYVPGLIEADQRGLPFRLNDGRKPALNEEQGHDAQMQYLIEKAREGTTGFTGTGGFGTAETTLRRAMPDYSEVTLSVLLAQNPSIPAEQQLNYDFRTPNPRATLNRGAAPAGGAGPINAGPGGPGGPGGPLPGSAPGRGGRVAGPEDGE